MKFKNVSIVSTLDGLISIFCDHERKDIYHEYFFLNKEHKLVAHFESTGCLIAEQLNEDVENIFYLSETTWDNGIDKERHVIVRVNPDLTYDVLHHIEEYEAGIEDGAFGIKKDGLYGFIDAYGNEFIKPQYENYASFSFGLAGVYKDGKWGFINKQNEVVIPFEYEIQTDRQRLFTKYENKLYVSVMKNGKWGIIDSNNKVIIPFKYDDIGYANKIICAKKGDKYGFIDLNDNIILPFEYDKDEDEFNYYCDLEEYHLTAKNGLVGVIDNDANFVIPIEYKNLGIYNNKVIFAKKQNDKCILIDFENNPISDEYDYIRNFSDDGMYSVYNYIEGKRYWGFIKDTGKPAIPLKYRNTKWFKGGLGLVETHDFKTEVINKNGDVLYRTNKYKEVYNIGDGHILAENNDGEFEIKNLI